MFGVASGWVIYQEQLEAFREIKDQPYSPIVIRKKSSELVVDLAGAYLTALPVAVLVAALAFNRTMISAPFLVMTPVPIAIRIPFIIALKFWSVPNPTLIFVIPNPIGIIRRRTYRNRNGLSCYFRSES